MVAVLITGRPLYVNPALNAADAFVVVWLPGSEGGGIADVLVGGEAGRPRFDFTGKLPAAWPVAAQMSEGTLYDFGYGLSYAAPMGRWSALPEIDASTLAGDSRLWFSAGSPAARWSLLVSGQANGDQTRITTVPAEALGGRARITAENYLVQEGARRFAIDGGMASVQLRNFEPVDIDRETNADILLLVTMKVFDAPDSARIGAAGPDSRGFTRFAMAETDDFVRYGIPLKCLRLKGADVTSLTEPFVLETTGAVDFAIGEVRLGTDAETTLSCD